MSPTFRLSTREEAFPQEPEHSTLFSQEEAAHSFPRRAFQTGSPHPNPTHPHPPPRLCPIHFSRAGGVVGAGVLRRQMCRWGPRSEAASILFTVIISIYRYQKLRDARSRLNLPIYLDNIRSAWMLSGVCVMISILLGLPIFAIIPQGSAQNLTRNSSCPPDFFQCAENDCPTLNRVYKYLFSLTCHLLPLIIVTITSCLIVAVLLRQRKKRTV
ncbi:unnamed protein product [Menidia menidia]|uniref:(Atlantic silverside) hypothetical protein n=1 Tax=Menidia menidia TaxID=238744 RepID=A0A8S4BDI9_9TELE|nr:unnamed protein product [Menidia menidia]